MGAPTASAIGCRAVTGSAGPSVEVLRAQPEALPHLRLAVASCSKRGFVRCASFSHLLALFTQHWLALAPAGRRSDLHPLERRSSHLALPRLIGVRDDSHAPSISSSEASFQSSTGLLALPTRAKSCRIARAHGNLSSALAACQVPRSQSTLRHAQLQPSGIQPPSHSNLPRATMPG